MIGIDMEIIDRFAHWTDEGFKRVFSDCEIEYASQFENRIEHFCGFFCAKEALVKALDDDGVCYKHVEIDHTETGKPFIKMTDYMRQILSEHGYSKVELSISHTKTQAVAMVLVM